MVQPAIDDGPTEDPPSVDPDSRKWSRRRVLVYALAGVGVAVVGGAADWNSSPTECFLASNHWTNETCPQLIAAVAAISPALWTSYSETGARSAGAFASAEAFRANNVLSHASLLKDKPVRLASGHDDPFTRELRPWPVPYRPAPPWRS
jgi:hypothetical protein